MTLAETWEASYVLSDSQKELYMLLSDRSKQLPPPEPLRGVPWDEGSPSSLSRKGSLVTPHHRSSSPSRKSPTRSQPKPGSHQGPIETTQQFLAWFSDIQKSMSAGQEESYTDALLQTRTCLQVCREILDQFQTAKDVVAQLQERNAFVFDRTRGLQVACERLLEDQVSLFILGIGVEEGLY